MKLQYIGLLPLLIVMVWVHYLLWKSRGLPYYDKPLFAQVVAIVFWMVVIIAGAIWAIS